MKKKMKKAFTLVELLVVIAILAVLSTVAVVGYNSFTEKARISNDKGLVTQLNTLLQADEAADGKAATPTEALAVVAENGFDVSKMTPTADDYEIIWNEETNRYVLLDEKDEAVIEELSATAHKNWQFINNVNSAKNGYSVYLNDDFTGTEITVTSGIDTGKNSSVLVNYETSDTESVVVRTNGGNLNIKAPNASVNHYGNANLVNIQEVASNSYHVYGEVVKLEVIKGRVVVENTGSVNTIFVSDSNASNVSLQSNGKISMIYAPESLSTTGNVPAKSEVITSENAEWHLVNTREELKSALEAKEPKIALGADIVFNEEYGDGLNLNQFTVNYDAELNLNTHTISAKLDCTLKAPKNNALFNITKCNFVLSGSGIIEYEQLNNNFGWGAYSSTLSINYGSATINDAVIVRHLGGTDMAYAIDVLTNGTLGDASLIINGGLVESMNYRSIRAFCNSTTNTASITINGGVVRSYQNNTIWLQQPSSKANKGALTITGGLIDSVGTSKPINIPSDSLFNVVKNITGGTFKSNGVELSGQNIYK